MKLKDQVAIVTGGAGDIGRETCALFVQEGAKVVIAELYVDDANQVAEEFRSKGHEVEAIETNVCQFEDVEKMAKTTLDKLGRIDVLANVAGGSAGRFIKTGYSNFAESSPERWYEIINLNLYGTLNCTRAVLPYMLQNRRGKIVNLSSAAGMIGMRRAAEYSAAKAGVIGFTKSVAKEVAPLGICINSVAPGVIGTRRTQNVNKDTLEEWIDGIPYGRLGKPEEVARAILFLSTSDSDYITGENIPVTGGQVLGPKGY